MKHGFERGYFGIGIYQTKNWLNVGTLWRTAHNLGAAFIFTIGTRYKKQASDTTTAMDSIPLVRYPTLEDFQRCRPIDCRLVGVEQAGGAVSLVTFEHPEKALYLLGAEDTGLPEAVIQKCQSLVQIPSKSCLNVAVAGSIVLYDRVAKRMRD